MRQRITITDVAARAGVSRTTVSLVLADHPRISAATKDAVRTAMRELGYVYNRTAEAVRAGRSSLVGLVLTDIRNPFFADITMAVAASVAERRMSLLQGFSQSEPRREADTVRSLIEHQVAGLILLASAHATATSLGLAAGPLPTAVVQLLRDVPHLEADFVGIDNRLSGQVLGEHLAAVGIERVHVVGSDRRSRLLQERIAGIARGLGTPIEQDAVSVAPDELRAALARGVPLDCVVTYNDTYTLAVMHVLRDQGLEPGRDIAVASFDNTPVTSDVAPGVTSVDHHATRLAEEATRLLFLRWEDPDAPPRRVLVAPSLVVRESTAYRGR